MKHQTQSVMVNPQGGLTFCDLSHGWRSDCAAGPLYPCYVEEVLPSDYMSLSFTAEVKTEPAKAPTMGTYDCYIETFFVRMANYYSQLHTNLPNSHMLEPGVGSFHVITPGVSINAGKVEFKPGSLSDYMGCPTSGIWSELDSVSNASYRRRIPLVPFAAYYDIFRSWYCDPQSPYFYVGSVIDDGGYSYGFAQRNLADLEQSLQMIYNNPTAVTSFCPDAATVSGTSISYIGALAFRGDVYSETLPEDSVSTIGLVLGAYNPDLMNNFLNSDTVGNMLSRATMVVSDNQLSFEQIIATEQNFTFDNRSVLAGGRYRDWVRAQYNVTPSTDLCQPQFLGRIHWTVGFQDVVANTAANEQVLGDLGGRGFGQVEGSRPIRMAFSDNGYIISIFRIVPRLDYNHYVEPYLQRTTTEDIFTPAYDNAPFEPVYPHDVDATVVTYPATGNPTPIGYRPAWSGYRYRVNRSHGSFASPSQSFWVLQRSFTNIDPASDFGEKEDDIFTPYINPIDGNTPFAVLGNSARNFRVQIAVSSKWRRPIKPNSLPSLK
jgi:hypothetical protein